MSVKNSLIPIGPVRRVLLAWERTQGYDDIDKKHSKGSESAVRVMGPIPRLAHYVGVEEDTLYAIRGRKGKQYVDFDLADRIISCIDVNLWRNDEELAAIYEGFDLTLLDVSRPTAVNEADELLKTSLSQTKIARLLGVHHSVVNNYVRQKAAA